MTAAPQSLGSLELSLKEEQLHRRTLQRPHHGIRRYKGKRFVETLHVMERFSNTRQIENYVYTGWIVVFRECWVLRQIDRTRIGSQDCWIECEKGKKKKLVKRYTNIVYSTSDSVSKPSQSRLEAYEAWFLTVIPSANSWNLPTGQWDTPTSAHTNCYGICRELSRPINSMNYSFKCLIQARINSLLNINRSLQLRRQYSLGGADAAKKLGKEDWLGLVSFLISTGSLHHAGRWDSPRRVKCDGGQSRIVGTNYYYSKIYIIMFDFEPYIWYRTLSPKLVFSQNLSRRSS